LGDSLYDICVGIFGFVLGLPVGILLFLTRKGQLLENVVYNRILSVLVNIFRSIPFIILIVWMIPLQEVWSEHQLG
jgi:D-methionine transport system permease protein